MRLSKTVIVATLVLGTLLSAGRVAQTAAQRSEIDTKAMAARTITALNECIQERFKDVDERLGFTRLIKIGSTPHRFVPESVREMAVVGELQRARLRVVLYLAGRLVMGERPPLSHPMAPDGWGVIKGPVELTPVATPHGSDSSAPVPSPRNLWNESRAALRAFEAGRSYEFEADGWNVSARAVRASSEACLNCHRERDGGGSFLRRPTLRPEDNPLRVGDPLGVVLYAYRRSR